IIAGGNPPQELYEVVRDLPNVKLVSNPSTTKMSQLITEAGANVLITFQSTGIKLKLLNALYKGGFCIVNDKMTESTRVVDLCLVTHSDKDLVEAIKVTLSKVFCEEDESKRREMLIKYYDNDENIKILTSLL
ncbi:MAG: hypothetical protein RR341_00950, partial [Bacteroidales bacterium]